MSENPCSRRSKIIMGNPGEGLIFHSVQVFKLLQVSRAVTSCAALRALSHGVIALGLLSSKRVKGDLCPVILQ